MIMRTMLREDETKEKEATAINIQVATGQLVATEQKLDKLLEAFLNNQVDQETYQNKKNQLLYLKLDFKDKLNDLNSGEIAWIEMVRHFIKLAVASREIAREKNNQHQLAQMLKKVGSKYLLKGRKIEFCLDFPFQTLAEWGGSASVWETRMEMIAFGQSKYYVDNLSENVKRGLCQKLRNGVWPAKAPYGYINNPKTRGIDVDPEKSKAIKRSFEMFAEGNHTFTDVTKFLHNFNLKRKNGKPLHINEIRQILTSKFYIGIMFYNGEYHDGNHKCFIPKELFQKTQEEINRRSKHFKKSYRFPFLGLAKCSGCGAAITAEQHIKFYKTTNRKVTYI